MAARLDGYHCKLAITRERQRFSKIHESNRDIFMWRSCSCLRCGVEVNAVPGDRMSEWMTHKTTTVTLRPRVNKIKMLDLTNAHYYFYAHKLATKLTCRKCNRSKNGYETFDVQYVAQVEIKHSWLVVHMHWCKPRIADFLSKIWVTTSLHYWNVWSQYNCFVPTTLINTWCINVYLL